MPPAFSWSKSRAESFKSCKRQYFLNYYASWGAWYPNATAEQKLIYMFKNLDNRHSWLGSLVHDGIEHLLNGWRESGQLLPYEDWVKWIRSKKDADWESSINGRYRADPKNNFGLIEHELNIDVTPDMMKKLHAKFEPSLKNFYESSVLKEMLTVPSTSWLSIENMSTFKLFDTNIYSAPDVAYKVDGDPLHVKLYDWKTGEPYPNDRAQVILYGMWLCEKHGFKFPEIQLGLYYLPSNKLVTFVATATEVQEVLDSVQKSIQDMKQILRNPNVNVALKDDFPLKYPKGWECDYCSFRKLCWGR